MNSVKALFLKQVSDLPKNMSITIMYIMFPLLSLIVGGFMQEQDPEGAAAINLQFAMMFVGMTPLVAVANTIAEDNEYKSLRFLVMAGVKPIQYLLGLLSFVMIMSALPILAFGLVGGLGGTDLLVFMGLCLLGAFAACILGAVIGLFSKNVQQCSTIYTPVMMILAFVPFISMFNETVESIGFAVFTQQIFMALMYIVMEIETFSFAGLPVSLAVIGANGLLFVILFAVAYRKKGLKG